MAKENRNYALDFLKFFFTVLIVLHHSGLLSQYLLRGYVAVELFFFISGYLMCTSFQKGLSLKEFTKKRLLRLYPPYLIVFLFVLAALAVTGRRSYESWYAPLLEAVLLQNVGIPKSGAINYPLWYLSVLFYGGTLLYAAKRALKKRWFNAIGILIVLLTYGYLAYTRGGVESWRTVFGVIYLPFWRGVSALLIGMWFRELPKPSLKVANLLQPVGFFAAILLMVLPNVSDFAAVLALAVLVYGSTEPNTVFHRLGQIGVLRACYPYQYHAYLVHAPAIVIARSAVGFIESRLAFRLPVVLDVALLLFVVAFSAVLIKSITDVLFRFFERLIKNRKRSEPKN
ncbi:MAG: acyltransferase [Clostridia bacterium]|nr:acyltransferase [Clostridia bacterium]